jgi:hypothetical protein
VEFGAVLSQMSEGYENAVAFCSTALSKAASNYCVTWLDLLNTVKMLIFFQTLRIPPADRPLFPDLAP